ncbi:MAG: sigma 54-interacting transcriptional regulator [Deltaproteobacteria bacterium]|jgi:PAS domain S-box-containing protein|nr:sigma 54-interacting transcriptional regulator [Deltaproteobacteria bacterium]
MLLSGINIDNIIHKEKNETLEERIAYFESLKKISAAKAKFIETGAIDPVVRPEIAESWVRASRYLDPVKPAVIHMSEKEMQDCHTKNALLIKCGSYVMDSIYKIMSDHSTMMHISDKNANILAVNDDYSKAIISRDAISPGARFAEDKLGTNSLCLSYIHDKDMLVHGAEHFFVYQHNVTCTTSLIRNVKNEVIGGITLTFNIDVYHDLLITISKIAARMIEKEIVKHTFSNVLELTINNSIESIIVTDSNLKIVTANTKFLNLLGIKADDVTDLDISKLIPEINFHEDINSILNSDVQEVTLYHNNRQYQLTFHAKLAYNDDSFDYLIFFFQEITSMIDLSRRFSGKYNYHTFSDIITKDPSMVKLIVDCKRIASLDVPILITGSSGTGKELFAQSIHSYGNRADKPFIAVNCAALPSNLIESELFGYDKGAFTGAQMGKPGKFELADGGTIFLDEIGELPLDVQAKILRILDDYKVSRIGSAKEKLLNVRVIAATNRDLEEEVLKKNFRLDLFYRLNVLNTYIPPLIQRQGDVRILSYHFLNKLNEKNYPNPKKYISEETIDYLNKYHWPGNIRQLQNTITRAYYLSEDEVIDSKYFTLSLPLRNLEPGDGNWGQEAQERTDSQRMDKSSERRLIESALRQHDGQVGPASESINMPVSSFYRKIKKYNIARQRYNVRKI